MPMIDVYAAAGTFADEHQLAVDLASMLMKIEKVPDITLFRANTPRLAQEGNPHDHGHQQQPHKAIL